MKNVDLIVEMMREHDLETAELDMVEVSMNYIENLYPSPEAFGRADSRRAGEGGRTKFFAANAAACELFRRTEQEICAVGRQGLVDSD